MPRISKKKQLISKRLTPRQLTQIREDEIEMDMSNLIDRDPKKRAAQFFLGYYSKSGIKLALEKYGVFEVLEKRGFHNLQLEVNTDDPFLQKLCIYFEKKDKNHLLVEIVLKRKHLTISPLFPSDIHGQSFEFLCVEWLTLQNPKTKFSPDRPPLPGQQYPGLNAASTVYELLVLSCKRLRLAGILNVPEYFHNAHIYSKTFKFWDPKYEGKKVALQRDLLKKHALADVSRAIDLECVRENNKPFKWFISELIMPLDKKLQDYFSSSDYKKYVKQKSEQYSYSLDEGCLKKKKSG